MIKACIFTALIFMAFPIMDYISAKNAPGVLVACYWIVYVVLLTALYIHKEEGNKNA